MVLMVTALTYGVSLLLTFCYFGKMASDSYEELGDAFYESNWQSFTVEIQKHFILCLKSAQKPAQYRGFGVFILNFETFAMV